MTAVVFARAFSPDGRRVVTASCGQDGAGVGCGERRPVGEPLRHDGWVVTRERSVPMAAGW